MRREHFRMKMMLRRRETTRRRRRERNNWKRGHFCGECLVSRYTWGILAV